MTTSVSSGSNEMDALLGGGLARGTSTLITGAAGTGKSVLAFQFAMSVAHKGGRAAVYMFDERTPTAIERARGIWPDVSDPTFGGRLVMRQVEPTEMAPGEFTTMVSRAVDDGTTLVVIDSLNGFLQSMPNERLLAVHVHEMLSYLASRGVSTVMTLVQRGVFGAPVDEAAEVSYLADTVILLRYFEHAGAVRQAVSVVKKRTGPHERTIRECRVEPGGFRVGDPLTAFQGVLTGVPVYEGDQSPLMGSPPSRSGSPSSLTRRTSRRGPNGSTDPADHK